MIIIIIMLSYTVCCPNAMPRAESLHGFSILHSYINSCSPAPFPAGTHNFH